MNPCITRPRTAPLIAALLLLIAPLAAAQVPQPGPAGGDGISVAGSGEAKGKPTAVEIGATVSGDAELAADAIVKYRDTKRRAVEALEGLKLEGLKIESGGFAINQGMDAAQQQAMMNGNAVAGSAKQRVTVTEQIKVVLSGLDKLKDEELMDTVLKVVDTGRDGGLQIGSGQPRNYYEMQMYYNSGRGNSNLVNFVIPDAESLRDAAYKNAMADARKRAERLAGLAGVKLGRIVSVRDQGAVNMSPQQAQIYAMTGQMSSESPDQLSSGVFTEIPVRVNLAVQFEIVAGEPRADAGAEDGVANARREMDEELRATIDRLRAEIDSELLDDPLAKRVLAAREEALSRIQEFPDRREELKDKLTETRKSGAEAEAAAKTAIAESERLRSTAATELQRIREHLDHEESKVADRDDDRGNGADNNVAE